MNFLTEWFSGMNHVTKKALAFTLAGVIVFSVGFLSGTYSKIDGLLQSDALAQKINEATAGSNQTVSQSQPAPAPTENTTPAPTEGTSDAPSTEAPVTEAPTENSGAEKGAPSTPAEIIAYFNESANKIKTNATSVTRNWEDLRADNEHLVVPSALQSIGEKLMSTFLKKDETPLVWSTKEDIIANYPVKTETFVSNATEADIAEATCTDDGTYYNITLKFNECTDPTGSGCANAFNIIKPEEVYAAASVVQNFSCKYYDAKIECKVEKATGNMVAATYTLPIIMQVTAKVLMTLDAQVGMTFIDDYTIAY